MAPELISVLANVGKIGWRGWNVKRV